MFRTVLGSMVVDRLGGSYVCRISNCGGLYGV